MYCSSCGATLANGLKFCNHCGTRLRSATDSDSKSTELFPDSLVWAMVSVFVVGLGCIIGLMAVMKDGNFDPKLILGFTLLSFLVMLAVEGVLIGLLLSRRRSTKQPDVITGPEGKATKELAGPEKRRLAEPPLSVTEHTTRTLEPVYRERKSE